MRRIGVMAGIVLALVPAAATAAPLPDGASSQPDGGAGLIAFVRGSQIAVMNADGSAQRATGFTGDRPVLSAANALAFRQPGLVFTGAVTGGATSEWSARFNQVADPVLRVDGAPFFLDGLGNAGTYLGSRISDELTRAQPRIAMIDRGGGMRDYVAADGIDGIASVAGGSLLVLETGSKLVRMPLTIRTVPGEGTRVDPDGPAVTVVPRGVTGIDWAELGPDGRTAAVHGSNGQTGGLYLVDTTSGASTFVVAGGRHPTWITPTDLAYEDLVAGRAEIFRVPAAAGRRPLQLTGLGCSYSTIAVGAARAYGCFTERRDAQGKATGVFATDHEAWLGGLDLQPRTGAHLLVEPGSTTAPLRSEGGTVDLLLGGAPLPAPLAQIRPFQASFVLGANIAGQVGRLAALPVLKAVGAQVEVAWTPTGTGAKLTAQVSVDELTKNAGQAISKAATTSIGSLLAKLSLTLANGQATTLTGADLDVPEFALLLKEAEPPLKLGFGGGKAKARLVNGQVQWQAEGTLLLPFEDDLGGKRQGTLLGRVFFTDGQMDGWGAGVTGVDVPIGKTSWTLTGFEGNVISRPPTTFDIGVTAEQQTAARKLTVFKVTGNLRAFRLAASDCANGLNPIGFAGTGNIPPFDDAKIGKAKVTLTLCAYVPSSLRFAFEAGVGLDATLDIGSATKAAGVKGSATGWFSGTDFSLEGSYQLSLPLLGDRSAKGLISSEGYAICAQSGFLVAGIASENWLLPPHDIIGCDFAPYRVVPKAAPARGRAASAPQGVVVPTQALGLALAVRSAGAAPRVVVAGPAGQRIETPAGATPLITADAIVLPVDELHTTYVFLHRPAAGRWTVEPATGSAAVASIETAAQLPAPTVTGSVRGRTGTVALRWTSAPVAGQKVELVDRAEGVATTIQRATAASGGTLRFTPASPWVRARRIEAVVTRGGIPVRRLVVARYTLPRLARPGRVRKLAAGRHGTRLTVRWKATSAAADYVLTVRRGATTVARTLTRRTRITVLRVPKGALVVTVAARDALGRSGRAARATAR